MPGCAVLDGPKALAPPLIVEVAPIKCPPVPAKARAEFRRTTPAPAGDLNRKKTREWVDALRLSEARKNDAGAGVIREHDACVGAPASAPIS